MSGCRTKARHCTRTAPGNSAASARCRRRRPTKHHGHVTSEKTSSSTGSLTPRLYRPLVCPEGAGRHEERRGHEGEDERALQGHLPPVRIGGQRLAPGHDGPVERVEL